MDTYLYQRIGKQSLWFGNELRDCDRNDRLISRLLTCALLAAIVAAMLHVVHLWGSVVEDTASGDSPWRIAIGSLAIVLPPLGTALISLRALYNFRARSRIYRHEWRQIQTQKANLEALILEAKRGLGASRDLDKIHFDFRALALRVEASLSFEMEQWMLLMERQEQEVSP